MTPRAATALVVPVALLLVVASAVVARAGAATSAPMGKIAFTGGSGDKDALYLINPDGTGERQWMPRSRSSDEPVWSPSGRKIAFVNGRAARDEIYVMNPDGTRMRRLTRNSYADIAPTWSPDEQRIAFLGGPGGGTDIFVMRWAPTLVSRPSCERASSASSEFDKTTGVSRFALSTGRSTTWTSGSRAQCRRQSFSGH